ncbi:sensor domain-containing diguanylate cyclase [Paenibacillus thailandensis]|uniref:Sensor domain-containing diguanylate cyclase n=1 Tax=Paenibacillus thailandensis TaxID=393250 RepID=A0ABW5QYA3_9BACL
MTRNEECGGIPIVPADKDRSIQSGLGSIRDEAAPDADLPVIRPLLQESFAEWRKETESFFRRISVLLFDESGALVCSEGSLAADPRSLESVRDCAARLPFRQPVEPVRREWESCAAYLTPVPGRSDAPLAVLAFAAENDAALPDESAMEMSAMAWKQCYYRLLERREINGLIAGQKRAFKEAERNEALFQAAKRLYDQFEVPAVLSELLASMDKLYPGSKAHLYLSQDYRHEDARVKPLMLKHTSHDLVAKAFLEGTNAVETQLDGSVDIAVPMTGKQAIYGVLCASFRAEDWDETVLSAFSLLAELAGTAFENAKLYEQSNTLIDELRLINELAKRLSQSLRLKQIFQFITAEMLSIFEADYCSVLQLDPDTKQFTVMSSNIPGADTDRYLFDYGFCGIMFRTKEPLIISDYWQTRVVSSKLMENTGARSLIASPILVENEVVGAILIMHKNPNYFSYDNYKLLQVICTHIALAVTNASLHAEVRRMVITDHLTGLHTRHYLNEQIQRRQRKDRLGSLVLVDIDYFKQINDTFGHLTGDRILVQVSDIVKASIRQDDIAARWGGEELAIYLPGIRWDQAYRIAERIRKKVKEETDPEVTVSCGVSEWTHDSEKISVESLFNRADIALYEAKNNGKDCIYVR